MGKSRCAALLLLALLAGCLQPPLAETREVVPRGDVAERADVGLRVLGILDAQGGPVGHATHATVTVLPHGSGAIRIDSAIAVAADTQRSILDAATAAAYVAGVDPRAFDYEVRLGPDAGRLSGPSAGSQFALGFYVGLNNLLAPAEALAVRPDYAGTGTITRDGFIGPVGGVPVKAEAAAGLVRVFAYPTGALRNGSAWFAQPSGMEERCRDAGLQCVQVVTLADLIDVATQPAA